MKRGIFLAAITMYKAFPHLIMSFPFRLSRVSY